MEEACNLSVSQVFHKDGEKYAYVSFTNGKKHAEGKIPDCKILSYEGFEESEIAQLEIYMKLELANLKKMAAGIHVMRAFMKKE
ncbi:MAG: hypothetical protein HFJ05_05505 [Eubacterium sp.]|nr:hypothetical protein [Eubacterium sp.]